MRSSSLHFRVRSCTSHQALSLLSAFPFLSEGIPSRHILCIYHPTRAIADSPTAGANFQGVRQRISKLRVEQKKKYEELGWELTTEATTKAKTPATPKKRKGGDGEGGQETPVKKSRAKKAAKSEDKVQDDDEGDAKGEGLKEEDEEEVDQAV